MTGRSVVLDWDDSRDPNFSHFGVRRSTQPNTDTGTWTRLAPNYTASTATDSGLAAGKYYYYVTQADKAGAISGRSVVVSATVQRGAGAGANTDARRVRDHHGQRRGWCEDRRRVLAWARPHGLHRPDDHHHQRYGD
jgi:hypothetical protein